MRFVLALLAVLGIAASTLALREHYRTDTSPCSINEKWDCGIVNHSPYAVLWGVPVATIGIAGYLLLGALALKRWYGILLPVALAGLLFEHPRIEALSTLGWALMAYMTVIQFCIAYVCWFAALERLPASVAAIGTMAVPVIGVVVSAIALHEPLGVGQIAALVLTLAGVMLATRS